MTTRNVGAEGFRWFFGFVVSIEDPDKLGQIKVRVPDVHGDMPIDDIPYATVVVPSVSASLNGVGISPVGINVGSMVFGFFADGNEYNIPVVIGTINKINEGDVSKHDVSKLARGENSIVKKPFGNEPASAYKAQYPYNKTFTTAAGHAIEIDDTPGQERIHVYHKAGSYVEIDKSGRMVTKVMGDDYEIIVKDKNVLVGGNVKITVNGNVDMKVNGSYSLQAKTIKMNADNINLNSGSQPAARRGDKVANDDNAGSQPIVGGSSTVFIG